MNKTKTMLLLIVAIIFITLIVVVKPKEESIEMNYTFDNDIYTIGKKKYNIVSDSNLILIEVKDYGAIVANLYKDEAPITVENFKKLVSEEFYNGLTFHRVVKDFVIQTGDPTATGSGGSEENITGEFELNGIENNISHIKGTLSMARRGGNPDTEETMNSASSQFFITSSDATSLDGMYAAFGRVVNGISVVNKIEKVSVDGNDKPLKDVIINKIVFVNEGE